MGEKIGRKEIKKKGRKKVKSTKQKEIKGDGRGEEDRMKNRKEKRVGIKYLNQSTVLGLTQCIGIIINRHSSNFCYHWSWWLSG